MMMMMICHLLDTLQTCQGPWTIHLKVKVNVWTLTVLLMCYSATYMSQTRNQQRFTVSEVAADWNEPMVAAAHYVAIHFPR